MKIRHELVEAGETYTTAKGQSILDNPAPRAATMPDGRHLVSIAVATYPPETPNTPPPTRIACAALLVGDEYETAAGEQILGALTRGANTPAGHPVLLVATVHVDPPDATPGRGKVQITAPATNPPAA